MINKTHKVVLLGWVTLVVSLLLVTFRPMAVGATTKAGSWSSEMVVPYQQNGLVQVLTMFPQFESKDFCYNNPWLGDTATPPLLRSVLHVEAAYLKESATVVWTSTPPYVMEDGTLSIRATHLTLWISVLPPIHFLDVSGESVKMTMTVHKPDGSGDEYCRIDAELVGNVRVHIPAVGPSVPNTPFDYEGPRLTITITMVEP